MVRDAQAGIQRLPAKTLGLYMPCHSRTMAGEKQFPNLLPTANHTPQIFLQNPLFIPTSLVVVDGAKITESV